MSGQRQAPLRPAVYLWASLGRRDEPPSRVQVEACTTCAALVPVAEFDRHGIWHREIER